MGFDPLTYSCNRHLLSVSVARFAGAGSSVVSVHEPSLPSVGGKSGGGGGGTDGLC